MLPLPAKSEAISDKDYVHLLEGAFVTWTRQIKEVLKVDVSATLLVRPLRLVALGSPCMLCRGRGRPGQISSVLVMVSIQQPVICSC